VSSGFDPILLSRVEDAGINASAPPQQRWLDGWLVRFSPGKAKRARCINPVAPGLMPVEQKLEICRQLYMELGLELMVRVTPFSRPDDIDARLAGLRFQRHEETCVMVSGPLTNLPATPLPHGCRIEPLSHRALAETVGRFRGTPLAQREAHAERLQESPVPFRAFAVVSRDGMVAACGQYALEAELVGLYDVFTVEEKRSSGLATALCRHLLASARDCGAETAYLQVEGTNAGARRIYERLGFRVAYGYHYRINPFAPRDERGDSTGGGTGRPSSRAQRP
jgi:ribosomal protein S18 acetylase RimI-like enzyme